MIKRAVQCVYRNVAAPLEKVRGVERFARDGWEREPVLERDAIPTRGSGMSRNSTGKVIPQLTPVTVTKKVPGPVQKYAPDKCPLMRGLYEMVGTEKTPGGLSVHVIARCTGPSCGNGRIRTFTLTDWCEGAQKGCCRCVAAARRTARIEKRDALLTKILSEPKKPSMVRWHPGDRGRA